MNGQHAVCLLGHAGGARDHRSDTPLEPSWAATALLAAYDHVLFDSQWRPGDEQALAAALGDLNAARSNVDRLGQYRREPRGTGARSLA